MSKWLHKLPKNNKRSAKAKKAGTKKAQTVQNTDSIQNIDRYRSFLKIRKIISVILAGCTVIVLVIVLATAFFTGKFTEFFYQAKQMSAEDTYPVTLKEQSFTDAAGLDRYLAIMTKNGVIFLDEKGSKADETVLGYSSPILRSNGSGVMIYDHGGTQFEYAQPFQTGFSIETEQKIITGALSEAGNCAVATYHERYAAEVSVYNTDGSVSYRWYSASDKVISLAFDAGGKRLYVCCINAKDGFLQTIVYALSLGSEKEIYHTVLSDSVSPLYLHPMSDGRIAVVTTGSIEFLDSDGMISNAGYYYSDLYAVCGDEKYLAVAQQNVYNNTTNLIVYNSSGDRIASTEISDDPLEIDLNVTHLYALTNSELICWDFVGNGKEHLVPEENYAGMVYFDETIFLYNNNNITRAKDTVSDSSKTVG